MSTTPVTLDFSKAQSLSNSGVSLDFSKAQPISTEGMQYNADNSFVITPAPGESFLDTMKRAAAAGKTVTPQMIQSQTEKGLKLAPVVLGAAPIIGAALPATMAVAPGLMPPAVQGARTIATAAANHPIVTMVAIHLARELGVPLPKVLDVLGKFGQ